MGAVRIDRENLAARSNQQDLCIGDMAKELSVFEIRVGYAQSQIGAAWRSLFLRHDTLLIARMQPGALQLQNASVAYLGRCALPVISARRDGWRGRAGGVVAHRDLTRLRALPGRCRCCGLRRGDGPGL